MDTTEQPERRFSRLPSTGGTAIAAIALALLIVGGLNWALYGLLEIDLVALVLGELSLAARAVYVIVGLAALYGLSLFPRLGTAAPRARPQARRDSAI